MEVTGIVHDSRRVLPGNLFVALRGQHVDGHDYILSAISSGASAIIYDRPEWHIPSSVTAVCVEDSRSALPRLAANYYGHPERTLTLFGITGTNGKTTTNYILQHILNYCGKATGRIGTTGAAFKDLKFDLIHTTPEADLIYEILSAFKDRAAAAVTLEVSSHALVQNRVSGLPFQAAVFTNLTQDHLDYHEDFESYLKAKQLLFNMLPSSGTAIINADDPAAEKMVANCPARVVRFGFSPNSDYQIQNLRMKEAGMLLTLRSGSKTWNCQTNAVGKFNAYNVLAAVVVALESGSQLEEVLAACRILPPVPGRLEKMDISAPFQVYVDYAHTPDAMETVLSTLSEAYPSRNLIVIFGCGGDRDKSKRPVMGEIATRIANRVVITDDNPRTEAPMDIIHEIERGCTNRQNYTIIQERAQALRQTLEDAHSGDIIAILGKGHEPYQEINGKRIPYSDMTIVNEYMESYGNSA